MSSLRARIVVSDVDGGSCVCKGSCGGFSSSASGRRKEAYVCNQNSRRDETGGETAESDCGLPELESSKPFSKKIATFKVRTLWTCILISLFFIVLGGGHLYCAFLVIGVTVGVYREVISLKRRKEKDKKLPLFFVLRWYWFVVTVWWLGVPWLLPKLLKVTTYVPYLHIIQAYHSLATYSAVLLGFVMFILSLRRYTLRYQFGQLGMMLLTIVIVVAQSLIQIANIYRGLIWFFLPISLVVVNDVSAYIFGTLYGKTRLIQLSPKKTVEGYIGASVVTLLWAVLFTYCLQRYKVFTCPQQHIELRPFAMWLELECPANATFDLMTYRPPAWLNFVVRRDVIHATPMQFHALVLGIFAAFVAPFGGFFASAFKRAVKIKDFGDSIPGHGGITDRFDCQILMGMFTYVYLKTLLSPKASSASLLPSTVDEIMQAVQLLSVKELLDLMELLRALIRTKFAESLSDSQEKEDASSSSPVSVASASSSSYGVISSLLSTPSAPGNMAQSMCNVLPGSLSEFYQYYYNYNYNYNPSSLVSTSPSLDSSSCSSPVDNSFFRPDRSPTHPLFEDAASSDAYCLAALHRTNQSTVGSGAEGGYFLDCTLPSADGSVETPIG